MHLHPSTGLLRQAGPFRLNPAPKFLGELDLVISSLAMDLTVELRDATGRGYLDRVVHLLDHGAHMDAKDCDGKTALSWAARNGKLGVVQHLIKQGADKEAEDNDGRTAIMHAAKAGRLDVVQYLIEQRADLAGVSIGKETACSSTL